MEIAVQRADTFTCGLNVAECQFLGKGEPIMKVTIPRYSWRDQKGVSQTATT
ncbi:polyketide synthase [Aspergillus luchuensis]|uniref:Polyketide synthase n=1 Tax=Aspergillus kawachii TaxID=1069201 RepID=A0A146FQX8_ASPKA|nr:polyketide synthase [Aspergillus luchuensis]